jgi:hypothetical protein
MATYSNDLGTFWTWDEPDEDRLPDDDEQHDDGSGDAAGADDSDG